jgi:hypothetical protein
MFDEDDRLLREFLADGKREIADNGFSRRVARHLPERARWLNRLLMLVVSVVCVLLFYVMNGFQAVWATLREVVANNSDLLGLDPRTVVIVVLVLLALLWRKALSMA